MYHDESQPGCSGVQSLEKNVHDSNVGNFHDILNDEDSFDSNHSNSNDEDNALSEVDEEFLNNESQESYGVPPGIEFPKKKTGNPEQPLTRKTAKSIRMEE